MIVGALCKRIYKYETKERLVVDFPTLHYWHHPLVFESFRIIRVSLTEAFIRRIHISG